MQTFLDMQDELTEQLMVAASSTLFDTARIKKLLQDAHLWATGLYAWPELQKARDTDSVASQEYYDYPDDFKTDSLGEYLIYNSENYKRKTFRDYLEYKRLNPTSTKRIFADYGRQYFIFPTPTATLTKGITIWGQVQATQITADGDTTIFSLHDDTGNEAIVKKAFSVAMKRIDTDLSVTEEKGAVALLTVIWDKVQKRNQTAQPIDKAMFNVPNLFPDNQIMNIGNFNVDLGLED